MKKIMPYRDQRNCHPRDSEEKAKEALDKVRRLATTCKAEHKCSDACKE
jgi:hypothetical protein